MSNMLLEFQPTVDQQICCDGNRNTDIEEVTHEKREKFEMIILRPTHMLLTALRPDRKMYMSNVHATATCEE